MNVLLINGSPNPRGCTYTALSIVAEELNAQGIETKIVQVGQKNLRGCIGCRRCKQTGKCVFDDEVNQMAPLFEAADGLVIGSPVYFGSPNGGMMSFLDRLFYSTLFDKRMKVGASVVSARRGGNSASFDVLNKYFMISEMPVVSSRYWNMVHGYTPEDVMKDEEGVATMRVLGRNMAFLIKSIQFGKNEMGLPDVVPPVHTHFIRS